MLGGLNTELPGFSYSEVEKYKIYIRRYPEWNCNTDALYDFAYSISNNFLLKFL